MATARLDMRLDHTIKAKAEQAMALLGHKNLTEYVVKLMDENASRVIEQHNKFVVSETAFDAFMAACDKANQPNAALKSAHQYVKDNGFE